MPRLLTDGSINTDGMRYLINDCKDYYCRLEDNLINSTMPWGEIYRLNLVIGIDYFDFKENGAEHLSQILLNHCRLGTDRIDSSLDEAITSVLWTLNDLPFIKKILDYASILKVDDSYGKLKEIESALQTINYDYRLLRSKDVDAIVDAADSGDSVAMFRLGELMKNAKERVKIHTPYIICNDMMYNTWKEIAERVPDFSIMTNSVANNGNPFGSADYARNRNRILNTGIDIWEYEGGYSYHGKSILIDDDLSVIGSFNMDMRSTYLDTELMLVIRSKEINKQLEEGMMEYERVSRQVLEDGTYRDPYHVEPIELTKKRQRNVLLVQHLLGWARYLF